MKDFYRHGRKIIGVLRNYKDHATELGNTVPSTPLVFLKPTTSYVVQPNPILIPKAIGQVDYEVELGVVIKKPGRYIEKHLVQNYVEGYCLAIDLTARDLQRHAQNLGLPWTLAKGLDTFCPISDFLPKDAITLEELYGERMWLKVNGNLQQDAQIGDMTFKIDDLVSYISQYMLLEASDVILCGTPKGVGPLAIGDIVQAGIGHDFLRMQFKVMEKPATNMKSFVIKS